jgi:two-component system, chemotaxis family, CheB/CheR fusion protein
VEQDCAVSTIRKLVVLGASAGGLEALCLVLDHCPPDRHAAYVVIQHLSPDHPTLMDRLLARHTTMAVRLVEDAMPLAPDTLFLIPPGKHLGLQGEVLTLRPKPARGLALPIDDFLAEAAPQWGARLQAVILSGTGADGSRGLPHVSQEGGQIVVQSPETAAFDGMPRSALATGLVDATLAPENIGTWLARHEVLHRVHPVDEDRTEDTAEHTTARTIEIGMLPTGTHAPASEDLEHPEWIRALADIADRVQQQAGLPLNQYKPDMLWRRIRRRMQVLGLDHISAYAQFLAQQPAEASRLRKEVLIPVTHFFRDSEAFEALAHQAVPELLEHLPPEQPLRAWVAATATGEEAYSLAMQLQECCDTAHKWPSIKVYATDIEPTYLARAAAGRYPASIVHELTPQRLERFFTQQGDDYVVRPELRAMVVFARHDLLNDPPFTQMHLVMCRNMLIYLQPSAQQQALRRLHYALVPGGYMALGRSETPACLQDQLITLDSKARLFQSPRRARADNLRQMHLSPAAAAVRTPLVPAPTPSAGPMVEALQLLCRRHAPPALVLDAQGHVVQLIGEFGALLQLRAGHPSLQVQDLLPAELAPVMRQLMVVVNGQSGPVRSPALSLPGLKTLWPHEQLTLVAQRLDTSGTAAQVLVSFETEQEVRRTEVAAVELTLGDTTREQVEHLARELDMTRAHLQSSIEALQGSNEELQANNEELMSTNEELQSTNEELQSVNEELYTVNGEYQQQLEQLRDLHADLDGMQRASALPSIFVDEHLRLQRFSREATLLFNLRETDLGRSITDFSHRLEFPGLAQELQRAMHTGQTVEREVRSELGRWYLARIVPFGTLNTMGTTGATSTMGPTCATDTALPVMRRAVLLLVDLSSVRNVNRLQAIIDALPLNLAVLDFTGRIVSVNQPWMQFAQDNGDTELRSTGPGQNYLHTVRQAQTGNAAHDEDLRLIEFGLSAVLRGERQHFEHVYPCHAPHQPRWFALHAMHLRADGGGAVIAHYNVTRWKCARKEPSDAMVQPTP